MPNSSSQCSEDKVERRIADEVRLRELEMATQYKIEALEKSVDFLKSGLESVQKRVQWLLYLATAQIVFLGSPEALRVMTLIKGIMQ